MHNKIRHIIVFFLLVWGFTGGSVVKNLPTVWKTEISSWDRKNLWKSEWQPTPVFLPKESMDREAWQVTVHGVAKSLDMTEAAQQASMYTYYYRRLLKKENFSKVNIWRYC